MGSLVIVLPVLIGIVVVVVVVVMRRFARRLLARRIAVEQELVATGSEATASVTHAPGPMTGWNRSNGVWGQITFVFRDASGTERTVKRRVFMRQQGDVKIGDTTRIWYDPAAPGDPFRTVVELEQRNRPSR